MSKKSVQCIVIKHQKVPTLVSTRRGIPIESHITERLVKAIHSASIFEQDNFKQYNHDYWFG